MLYSKRVIRDVPQAKLVLLRNDSLVLSRLHSIYLTLIQGLCSSCPDNNAVYHSGRSRTALFINWPRVKLQIRAEQVYILWPNDRILHGFPKSVVERAISRVCQVHAVRIEES